MTMKSLGAFETSGMLHNNINILAYQNSQSSIQFVSTAIYSRFTSFFVRHIFLIPQVSNANRKSICAFPETFQSLGKYFVLTLLLCTVNKSFLWNLSTQSTPEYFHEDRIVRNFMCVYNSILTL